MSVEWSMEDRLACPFPAQSISWRIGRKSRDGETAMLLAYIDARDVMDRLDRACGFAGWQCRYALAAEGLLVCEIGLRIGDQWLWRANGAGDTKVEAEKGKCSDAFKRAAVLWGVGRYLYGLPSPRVELDAHGKWAADPVLPEWATVGGFIKRLEAQQSREKEHGPTE